MSTSKADSYRHAGSPVQLALGHAADAAHETAANLEDYGDETALSRSWRYFGDALADRADALDRSTDR